MHVERVHWHLQRGQPQQLRGRGPAYDSAHGDHGGGRSKGGVNDQWHVQLDTGVGVPVREDLRRGAGTSDLVESVLVSCHSVLCMK